MDIVIHDPNTTKVLIIRRKNGLTLVEWREGGTLKRAWVTPQMIESESDHYCWVHNPGVGIPFGVDWERLISFTASPIDLDRELKRTGIWTAEDLRLNPNAALGAIKSALGLDLAALQNAAREYEKQLEV